MTSFGQLKNSLRRLEDLNRNMGLLNKIKANRNALDEKEIKNQPVEFYLRVIHFFLAQYSADLYKVILDIVPNIKTLSDQKFVQTSLNIARKLFNITSKISVQQFLQVNKLTEKKLQFLVDLGESVANWQLNNRKKTGKENPKVNEIKTNYQTKGNTLYHHEEQDEDQQLQQRQITVKPTQLFLEQVSIFDKITQMENQAIISNKLRSLQSQQSKFSNKPLIKPNVFPKNVNYMVDDEQEQDSSYQATKVKDLPIKKQPIQQNHQPLSKHIEGQQQQNDFVTRDELNEVLIMISTLNTTVNNLVSKFNNLQTYVTNVVSKTEARVSLLQENVKIIKANI